MISGYHHCLCPPADYLDTSKDYETKSTAIIKKKVLTASGGVPGAQRPVAVFSNDGKSSTEGPAAGSYQKTRTQAGAHLVINEIRLVSTFCLFQMYMRDSLH